MRATAMVEGLGSKAYVGGGLLIAAFIECCRNESLSAGREVWDDPSYSVFLFLGDMLLLLWMWGVSLHVWQRCAVPWAALLGLQDTALARIDAPQSAVYTKAADLSIVYLGGFVAFNWVHRGSVESTNADTASGGGGGSSLTYDQQELGLRHAIPPMLLAYCAYCAVHPWAHKRVWWEHLWAVLCAPHFVVTFRCSYIGDILTSLVRVLAKALYSFLYLLQLPKALVTTGGLTALRTDGWWDTGFIQQGVLPWLTLLPLWLRLMQCLRRSVETGARWPHIANALKYTSAIVVVGLGALAPNIRAEYSMRAYLWVCGFVLATIYQFVWDITMDWGLLVPGTSPLADRSLSVASAVAALLGQGDTAAADGTGTGEAISTYAHQLLESSSSTSSGSSAGLEQPVIRRTALSRLLHWCIGTKALRKRRLLGPLWIYLAVLVGNLLLRFAWTLTLLPTNTTNASLAYSLLVTYLAPVVAAAEVLRRMVWGFLRLEWEHIEKSQQHSQSAAIEKGAATACSRKSAADADDDGELEDGGEKEEEEEQEDLPFQPMGMNGHDAASGSWLDWLSLGSASTAAARGGGSSVLYGAADPDGRLHAAAPFLRGLSNLLASAVEGTALMATRSITLCQYAFCSNSNDAAAAAAVNNEEENSSFDGHYKRLFDDAPWFVLPLPVAVIDTLVCRVDPFLGLGLSQPSSPSHQHQHQQGSECERERGSVLEELQQKALLVRKRQLLAEGVLFASSLLLFLFLLALL